MRLVYLRRRALFIWTSFFIENISNRLNYFYFFLFPKKNFSIWKCPKKQKIYDFLQFPLLHNFYCQFEMEYWTFLLKWIQMMFFKVINKIGFHFQKMFNVSLTRRKNSFVSIIAFFTFQIYSSSVISSGKHKIFSTKSMLYSGLFCLSEPFLKNCEVWILLWLFFFKNVAQLFWKPGRNSIDNNLGAGGEILYSLVKSKSIALYPSILHRSFIY